MDGHLVAHLGRRVAQSPSPWHGWCRDGPPGNTGRLGAIFELHAGAGLTGSTGSDCSGIAQSFQNTYGAICIWDWMDEKPK